ncbi:HlyD family secretion protein [Hyphomicrobium sp.]|uniref:HlyD family secretion protein n=1 Tax=Hyphomicrobium sp. TaxID=82 RepID=UPI002E36BF0E|nr:efflux RND transporter periplasmic adaptor subunit [Hyphomicrobium sp.]HEX2839783.1 efflux RND transporter periplasmic adaptor subunit [Hyphomicrobium sp.]
MRKIDPTLSAVAAAAVAAIATSVLLNHFTPSIGESARSISGDAYAADPAVPRPVWAASATGRVEPKEGEIRISTEVPGRVSDVIATTNDHVQAGDPLVLLDSDDLKPKLEAALSEADVRIRERDEEPATGVAKERQQAEDALFESEQALFKAQNTFDEAVRASKSSGGDANAVTAARDKLTQAQKKVADDRAKLDTVLAKPGLPLPTRLESALTVARTDVAQVQNAIDKTRVRAPSNGTVLNVWAKVGEMAAPSADAPIVLFGDTSSMRVRAEVEERDVTKIRLGQRVVVRADGYPEKDFEGVVTQIAPALGSPRITSRGPRRPNDVEVLEVLISLDGTPPLLTGMRVDAFFRHETSASAEQTR